MCQALGAVLQEVLKRKHYRMNLFPKDMTYCIQ